MFFLHLVSLLLNPLQSNLSPWQEKLSARSLITSLLWVALDATTMSSSSPLLSRLGQFWPPLPRQLWCSGRGYVLGLFSAHFVPLLWLLSFTPQSFPSPLTPRQLSLTPGQYSQLPIKPVFMRVCHRNLKLSIFKIKFITFPQILLLLLRSPSQDNW